MDARAILVECQSRFNDLILRVADELLTKRTCAAIVERFLRRSNVFYTARINYGVMAIVRGPRGALRQRNTTRMLVDRRGYQLSRFLFPLGPIVSVAVCRK